MHVDYASSPNYNNMSFEYVVTSRIQYTSVNSEIEKINNAIYLTTRFAPDSAKPLLQYSKEYLCSHDFHPPLHHGLPRVSGESPTPSLIGGQMGIKKG